MTPHAEIVRRVRSMVRGHFWRWNYKPSKFTKTAIRALLFDFLDREPTDEEMAAVMEQ